MVSSFLPGISVLPRHCSACNHTRQVIPILSTLTLHKCYPYALHLTTTNDAHTLYILTRNKMYPYSLYLHFSQQNKSTLCGARTRTKATCCRLCCELHAQKQHAADSAVSSHATPGPYIQVQMQGKAFCTGQHSFDGKGTNKACNALNSLYSTGC